MKQKQRQHCLGKVVKKIRISITTTNSNGSCSSSQLICKTRDVTLRGDYSFAQRVADTDFLLKEAIQLLIDAKLQ